MSRQSQTGILKARIKELEDELARIKAEVAAAYEAQAKSREEKYVAEIVYLRGKIEQFKNSNERS
jgi:hypothetical protein